MPRCRHAIPRRSWQQRIAAETLPTSAAGARAADGRAASDQRTLTADGPHRPTSMPRRSRGRRCAAAADGAHDADDAAMVPKRHENTSAQAVERRTSLLSRKPPIRHCRPQRKMRRDTSCLEEADAAAAERRNMLIRRRALPAHFARWIS